MQLRGTLALKEKINLEYGPKTQLAKEIHQEKYRSKGESFKEAMNRVAGALTEGEDEYYGFREILLNQRFLPGGRIQSAVGSPKETTAYNCLSGDTKIVTDKGVFKLEDIAGRDVLLLDGNGDWVKSHVYSHGRQSTLSVRLTNYRKSVWVRATKDHQWVVKGSDEKVKTEELKVRMKIPHITPSKRYDKKGLIHGLVYGDGTKNGSGFNLTVCSERGVTYKILEGYKYSEPRSAMGRCYYFYGDDAHTNLKKLPSEDFINPSYVTGFIRGLFLADGCISKDSQVIISGTFELYKWLLKYGPMAGFYVVGKSKLAEETNFGLRKKDIFNIRFDKRSVLEEDLLKNSHRLAHRADSDYWSVSEIIDEGNEEIVYCPSVPTTKSFVLSNGLLMGNCFVSCTIEDSMEGIMKAASEAATTMRLGGGIGFDFSTIRPKDARIKTLDSKSSGAVSFMKIFDAVCDTVRSAGNRRGAMMSVLRVDHPDVEEFIVAKQNEDQLTNFNMSVGITDEFMEAVNADEEFDLRFDGVVYDTVNARNLWNRIMRGTYSWSEPGVLFIDTANKFNNLWYTELLHCSNPCGEQILPPYGACLLGSFNMTKYSVPILDSYGINYNALREDIPKVVRAMDKVIDETKYPLPEHEEEAKSKRRMGIGLTGVANTIERMGYTYGSKKYLQEAEQLHKFLRDECYRASIDLAKEKGAFPAFDRDLYLKSEFIKTLPEDIRQGIADHGIRNSHLLSYAPTGTISITADNVSSSIEPVFSLSYYRSITCSSGEVSQAEVKDYAYNFWGVEGKKATELSTDEHLNVLALTTKYCDSAVSKTINVGDDVSWEDFKNIYMKAWKMGCKGVTTFRPSGKRYGILNEEKKEGGACYIDETTGMKSCS